MKKHFLKWFTLVELIIVITILAILSSIAFISFKSYTKYARNANRISSLNTLQIWLDTYFLKVNSLPKPYNHAVISLTGSSNIISYQWELWDEISRLIWINETPKDPYNWTFYKYSVNNKQKAYQILTYTESETSYLWNQTYANDILYNRSIKSIWKWVWILLDPSSNEIIKVDKELFWANSNDNFNVVMPNNSIINWKWIEIWWWLEMLSIKNWDFSYKKSCPEWFISVNWNPDLLQPWFCVAKYEMTYKNLNNEPTWALRGWNSYWPFDNPNCTIVNWWSNCTIDDFKSHNWWISSKPWYPITWYTQQEAITACKSIWGHLITDSEWMTLARNIEKVKENWLNWEIWTNIYNGISWYYWWNALWCNSSFSWKNWASSDNSYCHEKRTFKLSNWEEIWDLAWNLWEHVNKANTIDWTNYNTGLTQINSNNTDWWLWTNISDEERKRYWPSYNNLWNNNGVWTIYWVSSVVDNNIFARWWSAVNGTYTWLFAIYLDWDKDFFHDWNLWFRCAY